MDKEWSFSSSDAEETFCLCTRSMVLMRLLAELPQHESKEAE